MSLIGRWLVLNFRAQTDNQPRSHGLSKMADTVRKVFSRRVRHLGMTMIIKLKHYILPGSLNSPRHPTLGPKNLHVKYTN